MKNLTKFILIIIIFILGCNNSKKSEEDVFAKTGIYSTQNYTELVLTESDITQFFMSYPENEVVMNEVTQYYKNRNYQYAWFNKDGMTQAIPNFQNQLQNYSNDFDDNNFRIPQLDTLITLIKTDKSNSNLKENRAKKLELLLTTTFFKYSKKNFSGFVDSPYNLNWFIPRNKKNYQILLDSLVITNNTDRVWEPTNEYYLRLKEKLKQYRNIQKKGGFPTIVTTKKMLKVSESDSCILKIKEYLVLTQDLRMNDNTIVFTDTLAKAISNFQRRTGLKEDGQINLESIAELNKPVDFRIKQIMINMERLRWFPDEIESNFLLINIPEFKLHVFENNKKIWDTKVVVGKEVTRTSIFKGNISKIILNPYWNVPKSIIRNEILPILKRNPSYLRRNNFQVLSGNNIINPSRINWHNYKKNIPFAIRQKPGEDNALGKIKFLFPNDFSIYLHDTPSKNLFNESKRAFSHGCIRVQEPKKLALYLLRKDKNWDEEKIDSVLLTNKTLDIALQPNIPIYIVYFTAWVDNTGQINFRDDLYNLDVQLEMEIFDN
jgi:murein L,D-transpeptidase YcbB/YkuD